MKKLLSLLLLIGSFSAFSQTLSEILFCAGEIGDPQGPVVTELVVSEKNPDYLRGEYWHYRYSIEKANDGLVVSITHTSYPDKSYLNLYMPMLDADKSFSVSLPEGDNVTNKIGITCKRIK